MSSIDYINSLAARGIQLWVQDGKLQYQAPKDAVTPQLLAELKEHKAALLDLLEQFAATAGTYPLSYSQKSLWSLHQLNPRSAAYNVTYAAVLADTLDLAALRRSLDCLVARHPILRTRYRVADGQPQQQVATDASARLSVDKAFQADLPAIHEWIDSEANQPFDLAASPIRLKLLVNEPAGAPADSRSRPGPRHVLLLNVHHIAADFWSLEILVRELCLLYGMALQQQPLKLAPLRLQYKDFVQHEIDRLQGPAGRALAGFWEQELQAGLPALQLPTDRLRPPVKTENGRVHDLAFGPALSQAVKETARVLRVTPYMLLLGVYQLWLFLHTGQPRFAIGAPTAGRNLPGSEQVLGHFVNTTVLACELHAGEPFTELVARTRSMMLRVLDQQDYPFPLLVERMRPARDPSRSPVFQVMYNWNQLRGGTPESGPGGAPGLIGELLAASSTGTRGATHDLTLNMQDLGAEYVSAWTYNTDLFDAATVAAFATQYAGLVRQVLADAQQALATYRLAAAPARAQVLERIASAGPAAGPGRPPGPAITAPARARARAHPERLAWQLDGRALRGAEIEDAVATLGATLKECGAGAGSVVGVQLASAAELAVALRALLDIGAAAHFLPPQLPGAAEPAGAHAAPEVIIGSASSARMGWSPSSFSVTRAPHHQAPPRGEAAVPAARLAAFIAGLEQALELRPSSRMLLPAGTNLRLSAAAMVAALACGASICAAGDVSLEGLAHEDAAQAGRHADALARQIAQPGVTALLVPVLLLPRLAGSDLQRLDAVLAYGEHPQAVASFARRPGDSLVRFMPQFCLDAWAGPLAFVPDQAAWRLLVSACEPVVLGPHGDLADEHQCGRLHLLAPGSLPSTGAAGQDEHVPRPRDLAEACRSHGRSHALTATPLAATRRPGGALLCNDPCGRRIEHRVAPFETGPLEAAIARQPEVRQVACELHESLHGPVLVAYVELHEAQALPGAELRRRLMANLPEYMLPQGVVTLAHLPLQSDGRLNRPRLPPPPAQAGSRRSAPATEVERKLAAIWCEVLALPAVGMEDDFFELGGDSILAAVIVSKASLEGLYLRPKDVFANTTIAGLAQAVTAAPETLADQGPVTGTVMPGPASAWFFDRVDIDRSHFNQALLLQLRQVPDAALMDETLRQLARQHDVLRSRFAPDGARWLQVFDDGEAAPRFATVACVAADGSTSAARWDDAIAAAQGSLDIERGPLWTVRWLSAATPADCRLLVVVHHLLIDGVSWSILLQDLSDTYLRLQSNAAARLPLKTTSYKAWVEQLAAHAGSHAMEAERAFWDGWARQARQAWGEGPALPLKDGAGGAPAPQSRRIALDAGLSAALRADAHAAYGTDANDLLLAAVHAGFSAWSGSRALLVDVEGHGRDPFSTAVDLGRSIGWFTSIYPVLLEAPAPAAAALPALIKHVKQCLREVPRKGAGFGVLRYLDGPAGHGTLAALPRAPVLFTYLGQLDQMVGTSGLYTGTAEPAPGSRSARQPRTHPIDLCAYVSAGQMTIECGFDAARLPEAEADALLQQVQLALAGLIRHCCSAGAGGLTPSDVPAIDIDQAGLDQLLDEVAALDAR